MKLYPDSEAAVRHCYHILGRLDSPGSSLGGLGPGGDYTAQEWIAHAALVIRNLKDTIEGPYLRAIEAQYANEGRERAVDLLAPSIRCRHRGLRKHALRRWAFGHRVRPNWEHWTKTTCRGQRTLQIWTRSVFDQAEHFQNLGFRMANDRFQDLGIVEKVDAA